jgi:hypothetical protein
MGKKRKKTLAACSKTQQSNMHGVPVGMKNEPTFQLLEAQTQYRHYNNSTPLDTILRQFNPPTIVSMQCITIHFNIILPSYLSSKWPFPKRLFTKILYTFLVSFQLDKKTSCSLLSLTYLTSLAHMHNFT